MNVREGDIFEIIAGHCVWVEAVMHDGQLGLRGLTRTTSPPYWGHDTYPTGALKYIGNNTDTPGLKDFYRKIMQIDNLVHYAKAYQIPATLDYIPALRRWEEISAARAKSSAVHTNYDNYMQLKRSV